MRHRKCRIEFRDEPTVPHQSLMIRHQSQRAIDTFRVLVATCSLLGMPVRDVAPDEWECRVFIAVAEHRTFAAAAKALSAQTGKEYGSRAVAKVIAKIERWLGVPPFEQTLRRAKQPTARGEDFLRAARAIVGEYQALREPERAFTVPTLACMPHHLPMVAQAEAALAQKPGLRVEFLERDSYVGATAFGRYAVGRLQ